MSPSRLTKVFDQVLTKARQLGLKDAFIAGGAVRDLINDYEPKDIDVFTWTGLPEDSLMFTRDGTESAAEADPRVVAVSKTLITGFKYPVEVIQLKRVTNQEPIKQAIEDFAIGLDQAWYEDEPKWSKAFTEDWRAHTFTITRAMTPLEAKRSIAKINRLWDRKAYRDFRIVISYNYAEQFFSKAWIGGENNDQLG